MPVYITR